jgi:AraC-like DNA-binding protein
MDIAQDSAAPEALLSDLVESYWMIENLSGRAYDIVILPDGRVDLICSYSDNDPFEIRLMGLDDAPSYTSLAPGTKMFSVSFKLTAMEYVFHHGVSDLLNNSRTIQSDSWRFTKDDLTDFNSFRNKAATQIKSKLNGDLDPRKKKLFDLIYFSKGSRTVADLSEHAGWSSRQINRYFTEWFGLSLKTYSNILRFRASFPQLKEGKLFPEKDFADQAHFIKEIKRFSGVKPKDLAQNKDDRFIQFSTLRKK